VTAVLKTSDDFRRWLADVEMVDARLRQYEEVSRAILAELQDAKPWRQKDRKIIAQRQRAANAILVLCEQVRRRLVPSGNICHAVLDALMIGQWGGDGAFHFSNARARRREKQTSGKQRGRKIAKTAAELAVAIGKLAGQHDPDEHGPLVAWIATRKQISERTVRRHLAKRGQ
jgi:hypothetical protein